MKRTIIERLDRLIALTSEHNTYQLNELNAIKQELINEYNASDYYAEQIRQVLDMDVTYEMLNDIKIK